MNILDTVHGLILKELEIKNLDDAEKRSELQKKIYILQSLNVKLGYSFKWNITGPFSPELGEYVIDNIDILNKYDYSEVKLKNEVLDKIKRINDIGDKITSTQYKREWYNLIASILYIIRNREYWGEINSYLDVYKTLNKERINPIHKEVYKYTIEQMKDHNLFEGIKEDNTEFNNRPVFIIDAEKFNNDLSDNSKKQEEANKKRIGAEGRLKITTDISPLIQL